MRNGHTLLVRDALSMYVTTEKGNLGNLDLILDVFTRYRSTIH